MSQLRNKTKQTWGPNGKIYKYANVHIIVEKTGNCYPGQVYSCSHLQIYNSVKAYNSLKHHTNPT